MTQVPDDMLSQMAAAVVEEVDPERIYVFGSRARGDAGPNSDVDLLVVEREAFGPRRDRRQEAVRLWRALRSFAVPKDILVYSVDEVEKWRDARNHVIGHALREGKLLYERP